MNTLAVSVLLTLLLGIPSEMKHCGAIASLRIPDHRTGLPACLYCMLALCKCRSVCNEQVFYKKKLLDFITAIQSDNINLPLYFILAFLSIFTAKRVLYFNPKKLFWHARLSISTPKETSSSDRLLYFPN